MGPRIEEAVTRIETAVLSEHQKTRIIQSAKYKGELLHVVYAVRDSVQKCRDAIIKTSEDQDTKKVVDSAGDPARRMTDSAADNVKQTVGLIVEFTSAKSSTAESVKDAVVDAREAVKGTASEPKEVVDAQEKASTQIIDALVETSRHGKDTAADQSRTVEDTAREAALCVEDNVTVKSRSDPEVALTVDLAPGSALSTTIVDAIHRATDAGHAADYVGPSVDSALISTLAQAQLSAKSRRLSNRSSIQQNKPSSGTWSNLRNASSRRLERRWR
ncbi:hypothetical protein BGZ65_009272 [Modicella reniformis]|uniref:Uncharacterized protein n=1 Tax=Modicella reniformis TaxID=1440133 RepID=A0A9P6LRV8_9FUNG|nr:hypothetical protein BGZ65_009272 [Modicella reniformis]